MTDAPHYPAARKYAGTLADHFAQRIRVVPAKFRNVAVFAWSPQEAMVHAQRVESLLL